MGVSKSLSPIYKYGTLFWNIILKTFTKIIFKIILRQKSEETMNKLLGSAKYFDNNFPYWASFSGDKEPTRIGTIEKSRWLKKKRSNFR